jgi:hypothetical protein
MKDSRLQPQWNSLLNRLEVLRTTPYRQIILFIIPVIVLVSIISIGFAIEGSQQYALLASSFLHGHLNFLKPIGRAGQDPVFWHGKIYWSEGPFPAIILMPFEAIFGLFNIFFYQGYLKWLLVIGTWFFIFKIARALRYNKEDSTILAFGFTLGSVFIGISSVSASWYYAQVLNTFLLFWAFYEYFTNRRWWLIGIICALVFMTRATSTPLLLFFALEIWQLKLSKSKRFRMLLGLATPVGIAIVLIGLYNYLRFQSPFNGGYQSQLLHGNAIESRAMGIFSLKHIPSNFYYMVLTAPNPVLRDSGSWTLKFPFISNNMYGTSIFITSPYLLYLFQQKWKTFDVHSRNLIVATTLTALFVLSYYGVGLMQFGYRYSLDFLPGMFILFMIIYRKHHRSISRGMKFLLLGAGVLNFYLLWPMVI